VRGYRHTLAMEGDTDAVFRSFSRSRVQRRIEIAVERGIVVTMGNEASDLDNVFYGLHLMTRRRLGVPIQPKRFFRLLWERLLQEGLGFVVLAHAEGRPVAGAVFLAWRDSVIYKFGASDPSALKLHPNNLVIWRGIEWGCERGYRTFDFGRTDLGAEGLRRFKNGWNPVEQPLVYTTLGAEPQGSSAGVAESALGTVIRHSPLWVCRALGETLYRYAA
jgi:lipid II:glycine glycyltransferase (peptidoglycan interpeptide bridge formation enzyme)